MRRPSLFIMEINVNTMKKNPILGRWWNTTNTLYFDNIRQIRASVSNISNTIVPERLIKISKWFTTCNKLSDKLCLCQLSLLSFSIGSKIIVEWESICSSVHFHTVSIFFIGPVIIHSLNRQFAPYNQYVPKTVVFSISIKCRASTSKNEATSCISIISLVLVISEILRELYTGACNSASDFYSTYTNKVRICI